jgi:hypothetical protein
VFFELIATFVAGLGAAGVMLLVNRVLGGRLPKWTIPVAAGATMIGVAVWSEMTWGARTARSLPDSVEVAERVTDSAWWRPWTYVWPQTVRLVALDTESIRTNDTAEDTRLVDLYLFGRWRPTAFVPQLVRCSDPARADVTDAALADPGTAVWRPVSADSDLIRLACKEPANG